MLNQAPYDYDQPSAPYGQTTGNWDASSTFMFGMGTRGTRPVTPYVPATSSARIADAENIFRSINRRAAATDYSHVNDFLRY
jgi:hypothetical protein